MTLMVKDGTGKGYLAKVSKDNHLQVESVAETIQHHISKEEQQAYQLIGTANLAAAAVVCLHIKNTSSTRILVGTYIRHQIIDQSGGTALPNVSNYFKISFDRIYSSGGSSITPVNMYAGSGKAAEVTAFGSAPTLTGTANEFDRWYTKQEADMNVFIKEGSIILPPGQTMELAYVGDQTGGIIYSRLSFIMRKLEE